MLAGVEPIRRRPGPVLLILVAFGKRPKLVAAVIEPLPIVLSRRRKVLPLVFWIHKQIRMAGKRDLHEAPAELRHDGQPHPIVREFFRFPSFEIRGAKLALMMRCGKCAAAKSNHWSSEPHSGR